MLLALAFLLAFVWVMLFFAYQVTGAAVHVLILAAAVAAMVHFIRVRRLGRSRRPLPVATGPLLDSDQPLAERKPGDPQRRVG
jgi:hypothetical protein